MVVAMGEDYDETETDESRWAAEVVTSLSIARQAAQLLFVGAALAVVLGLVSSITMLFGNRGLSSFDSGSLELMQVGAAASSFAGTLLPAGLMLASGAALRLYAIRTETDIAGSDFS